MADAFGSDISCVAGLDPNFTLTSGAACVAQAIARRLTTPRGGLFYDPNYGTDVREILAAKIDRRRLEDWRARIETEVRKDDRVASVSASLVYLPATGILTIRIDGTLGTGPFTLTLAVTDLSVEIIPVG